MDNVDNNIVLSLCIPTNGIIEWVRPVLDSIYRDVTEKENEAFEVVITDNGNDTEFAAFVSDYQKSHLNLVYSKNTSKMFQNQIEAFKLAKGELIKFVNHRMVFRKGAVGHLIQFSEKFKDEKPGLYFMNKTLDYGTDLVETPCFDEFVAKMGYRSSWSAGTAMWRSDFLKMDYTKPFNRYFPHIDMVFSERKKKKYVIDNAELYDEITAEATKKAKYDIFDAFAVEYPAVILNLYREGDIRFDTLSKVFRDTEHFVAWIYEEYVILKHPCSYDLSGFGNAAKVFFDPSDIKRQALKNTAKRVIKKVIKSFRKG